MDKNIMILCTGYLFASDASFGYHVAKVLEKMQLPENVELMEVGESASEIPHILYDKDKLIVVDVFQTKDKPGTVVHLKQEEVPVTVDGITDAGKFHLIDTLEQIKMTGKHLETTFIGVVPEDITSFGSQLNPEIEKKIPEVIELIMREISQ